MKQAIFFTTMCSLFFASCGPNKKLQDANAQVTAQTVQINSLSGQIESLNKQLTDAQTIIGKLKNENLINLSEAEQCRKAKEAANLKLENFNKSLSSHGTSMEELRSKAANALKNFKNAGCTVNYKYGLIHVIMPEELLFEKNSTQISLNGKQAISVVADVMIEFKKMKAIVIGNSDSTVVKGSGSNYKDNWSLSTDRALSVIRVLRDKFEIDPKRLTAAGRSKYDPIADNSTEEGRAKNRRIEIILDPEFRKIWDTSAY